jgi:hypothetical protein
MYYTELFFKLVIWGVGLSLAFGAICWLLTGPVGALAKASDALDEVVRKWPSFINGDSILFRLAMSFAVLGVIFLVIQAFVAIAAVLQ